MPDTILYDSAMRLFGDLVTPEVSTAAERGVWPDRLWQAVEEAGYPDVLAEGAGGMVEAATILRAAGPPRRGRGGWPLGAAARCHRRRSGAALRGVVSRRADGRRHGSRPRIVDALCQRPCPVWPADRQVPGDPAATGVARRADG